MKRPFVSFLVRLASVALVLSLSVGALQAQTTSFSYQGRLTDGGSQATGVYDFEFRLFDALVGGNQVATTIIRDDVMVADGSFNVMLDFGAAAFPGANRYLEIGVRPGASTGEFTILNPLQQIATTPYSLQSLNAGNATTAQNALQLGGVAANQYVQTTDSRMNDARPPTAGSGNYIQSNPSSQQAASFNINGNGALGGTFSANSVGVGTTAPSTPLDVAGALSVRGSTAPPIAPLGQGRLYFDAGLNKFRISQNGGAFADLFGSVSGSGTTGVIPLWSNTTALSNSLISQSGSNIVIGTTSASAILDVQNSGGNALMRIRSTGNGSGTLFIDRAAAIASNSSQIGFYSAGNPDFTIGTSQGSAGNSDLSIYDYGIANNVLTILKSNGNVGIGTVSPQARAHVSSNSTSSTSLVLENIVLENIFGVQSRQLILSNYGSLGAGLYWAGFDSASTSSLLGPNLFVLRSTGGLVFSGSSTAEHMRIDTNGNVGIGTNAPTARLQVNGDIVGAGRIRLGTTAQQNSATLSVQSGNDSYGVYAVNGNGASFFSPSAAGVWGDSDSTSGVKGSSNSGAGVFGRSSSGPGLEVQSDSGNIVAGFGGPYPAFHITNNGTYVAGSDFAEALPVRGDIGSYEPGDVLVVSTKAPGKVEKASRPYDTRVVGIYSTRPGMLGADKNGASRVDADDVPVAIVGIVPTKVSAMNGPIRVGDLLTTSSTAGYAMRCGNRVKCVGAIVGKALEPISTGNRVIKVLVMLR